MTRRWQPSKGQKEMGFFSLFALDLPSGSGR